MNKRAKYEAGNSVACPHCGATCSFVIDSRAAEHKTRRRRRCLKCDERYTTYEIQSDYLAELESQVASYGYLLGFLKNAVKEVTK